MAQKRIHASDSARHKAWVANNRPKLNEYQKQNRPDYKPLEKRWVCWDGEAWGSEQNYQLLQSSDGLMLEKNPLTIRDALPYLCNRQTDGKLNINCFFVGNYDWNALFRYESRDVQASVFKTHTDRYTRLGDYGVQIVPRKFMKIWHAGRTHTFWDVWGFFSATGSFLKNLQKWKIPYDPIIDQGKLYRDSFPSDFDIKRYNFAETLALKALMEKFQEALKLAGYDRLRQYQGSGAIANLILHECNAKEAKEGDFSWEGRGQSLSEMCESFSIHTGKLPLPIEFLEQAFWSHQGAGHNGTRLLTYKRAMGYFGGRIELLQRGTFDHVYNYDVNSCYPAATINLPALNTAKWKTFSNFTERDLDNYEQGLVEVKWKCGALEKLGPFPFRADGTDISKGYVIFPTVRQGGGFLTGIYHLVEVKEALVKAAREKLDWDIRLTGNAWVIEEEKDYPFKRIGELLSYRLKLKAEGNAGHEPIKLGLNSIYGKFAQRPAGSTNRDPPFRELFYAGAVTSWARAQLLKYVKPEAAILLCTDGAYSTEPLDCPLSANAGDWELETGPGHFLLTGLYQFNGKTKTRGYPKLDFHKAYSAVKTKGYFAVKDRLFVGIKKSLAQSNRYPHCGFYDITRKLDWNENEKRWMWISNGQAQESFPTRTVQETSAPYEWADSEEIAEKHVQDTSDTFDP